MYQQKVRIVKFKTKMKIFRGFTTLISAASGCLIAISFIRQNPTLFIASVSLGVSGGAYSIIIGFIDALLEDYHGLSTSTKRDGK